MKAGSLFTIRFILILLFAWNTSFGQETKTKNQLSIIESLSAQAQIMVKSIVERDYTTYIDLVYPPVVEVFGGKELMISATKTNKEAQIEAGMILVEAKLQNNSHELLEHNGLFQTIVPFNYTVEISGDRYQGVNYLLALTDKEEIRWTFVELETFDEKSIKEFIPEYSDMLEFPVIKGAEFIEK